MLEIGRQARVHEDCTLEAYGGTLRVGERAHICRGCVLSAGVAITIGDGAGTGEYSSVRDHDHVLGIPVTRYEYVRAPIVVGPGAWIAARVTITRGVSIGENAVIGANAVVTADVPARALAVGVPASVIRTF